MARKMKTLHRELGHKDIKNCLVGKFSNPIQCLKTQGLRTASLATSQITGNWRQKWKTTALTTLKCYFCHVTLSLRILPCCVSTSYHMLLNYLAWISSLLIMWPHATWSTIICRKMNEIIHETYLTTTSRT